MGWHKNISKILKNTGFLIGCLSCFISYGQSQISFKQLSVTDGLSQNSVISVAQDSTGYLWLATQDGLNRYDGKTFEIYEHYFVDITTPDHSYLGQVYVDRENNIWIIPVSGIPHLYDPAKNAFNPYPGPGEASVIYQAENMDIWFGSFSNGLSKEAHGTNAVQEVINAEQLSSVFSISEDSAGTIWVAGNNKIIGIDPLTQQGKEYFPDGNNSSEVNYSSILFDSEGNQFIGSFGNGMWYRERGSDNFKRFDLPENTAETLPDDLYVTAMYLDADNRVWIGTYGQGLYSINLNNLVLEHFSVKKHDPRALPYNDILCIYADYTGTLWFGTDGAGAGYYDKYLEKFNSVTNDQTPEDVNIDVVRSITIDENENIWIGTSGKGLTRHSTKDNTWKGYFENSGKTGLSSNRIMSLHVDEDELWIGTQEGGLNILDSNDNIKHFNEFSTPSLEATTIWTIFRDAEDNVWLGTRENGLIKFDKKTGVERVYGKHELQSNNIRVIIQEKDHRLWIGTEEDGFALFDPHTEVFTSFRSKPGQENSLSSNKIKSLYQDENGILWLGTNGGGLNAFDPVTDQFVHYTTDDGLANNVIYGILPDEDDNLWLSSNKGITRFTPPENFRGKPRIRNYNNYEGLATEFNTGAYYKAKNGELYFGGLEGFYWFNPGDLEENPVFPKTTITGFEVFNEAYPLTGKTVLKSRQNTVSFTFSGMQFTLPENNQYQFKLENYDQDWVESGNTENVRYTNLPPGDYTFLVKSSNYDGVWNEVPEAVSFSILNPWYFRGGAIITYILLLLTGALLFYSYLKWRWKMQLNLKRGQEEAQRLQELDDYKTRLYANLSHEFKTPLTLIKTPVQKQLENKELSQEVKKDLQLVQRNATKLLSLVHELLELSKLEAGNVKLNVQPGELDLLLKALCESFLLTAEEKGLRFHKSIPEITNVWYDEDVIEKIFNNLLSNALKYTSENGEVRFEVINHNGEFVTMHFINDIDEIKETDPNKIFNRFYQGDGSSEGSGIGLSLVKELVNLSGGTIKATYPDPNKIKFIINLPVYREAFSIEDISVHKKKKEEVLTEEDPEQLLNGKQLLNGHNSAAPIALVVEDHKDMRKFIISLINKDYKVHEAKNGKEGIEKALELVPDIVISDVRMPVTTGIELCNTLKKDERTSHIPIILLTAIDGEEGEIKGLETGADDYMTKPFNAKKLLLRMQKLIELRKELQVHYQQGNFQAPKDIPISSTEEKFLDRVQVLLDDHLTDTDFTAENFSKLMAMSRMQLHRKLIALTGLSTTAFIRSKRLKLGVHLIKTTDRSVAEIAYATGFNTPSYFIKCFKSEYGKTPSEYLTT